MRVLSLITVALLASSPLPARAEPVTLRMATIAPDGSVWAHEIRAGMREIEQLTHGQVRVKTFFGGIAGDEVQVAQRIRRDQLDGAFSGGILCQKLAPSLRVLSVVGLFQNRAEVGYVLSNLRATVDAELARAGFVELGLMTIGLGMPFTRRPLRNLADFMHTRMWSWDLDETLNAGLRALGVGGASASNERAAGLYDEGEVDGFVAAPLAALAFQWSSQARYLTPLPLSPLTACTLLTTRALDALSLDQQKLIRQEAAKVTARLEEQGRVQEEALIGGLFAKQGLTVVPPSAELRVQFGEAASAAREQLPARLVAEPLLLRVLGMLADYRAQRQQAQQQQHNRR